MLNKKFNDSFLALGISLALAVYFYFKGNINHAVYWLAFGLIIAGADYYIKTYPKSSLAKLDKSNPSLRWVLVGVLIVIARILVTNATFKVN